MKRKINWKKRVSVHVGGYCRGIIASGSHSLRSVRKTYDNYVSAKRRLRQRAIMLRLTRWKMLPLACAAEPEGQ